MFTPAAPSAGPTGGAGVAWPAWIWSLMMLAIFFLGAIALPYCGVVRAELITRSSHCRARSRAAGDGPRCDVTCTSRRRRPGSGVILVVFARHGAAHRSDLGDLVERQLDRGLAPEDGHQDLELLGLRVDLGDGGRHGLEGAVHDGDGLADLEVGDLLRSGGLARTGARAALLLRQADGRRQHGVDLVEAQR